MFSKVSHKSEKLASRTARKARPRGESASPQKEAQRESDQGGQHEGIAQEWVGGWSSLKIFLSMLVN